MPVSRHCKLLLCSFLIQCAEACIDSSGNFYCTTLWYFWFILFWVFMFIFVGVVCIVNRYNKKKREVAAQIQLPPLQRLGRSQNSNAQESLNTTTTTITTNNDY